MTHTSVKWIWQQTDWPHFYWQETVIQPLLREVRLTQGVLLGKTGAIVENVTLESALDTLLQNIIASSAIEGEQLNVQSVRSSLAKRIGLHLEKSYPTNKRSEGLAQMMLDAICNLDTPLSLARLLQWHQWLFPDDTISLLYPVKAGQLRGEEPMQVVSGRIDRPTVHYEAPPRERLEHELTAFITWFNQSLNDPVVDPLLRAAICHFWFVTLHPFEDGNGRITRALTDLALAQSDKQSIRLYAMSATILANRNDYYHILEKSQRNTMDITPWLCWFLRILEDSIQTAINKIDQTLVKSRFWQTFQTVDLSKEQIKVLNRMFDEADPNFELGISAAQYKKIAKVSKATATRHLADLLEKGCVEKLPGGGRSTRYQIKLKLS
ncbi:Fic family protein [Legionella clemsonensis]|uniref:Adenosine monophosphate-protein transferase SoFic n=1 Tax=Legionella clemsonensis TaxID=1867846 RepID=A0A222P224_9GAMM|nr:Fic family protein [Legionella clemsonensis]ASQ45871.1 Adenosine monophosphate-protein transferase SoFic [Legionella clemsonensis]